jgi:hypothetical protein
MAAIIVSMGIIGMMIIPAIITPVIDLLHR